MAFDYKKEYKELYQPKREPALIEVPKMNFIAVKGVGDPNEEGGAYQQALEILYGIAFTLRMSKKSGKELQGFFEYVVPPLEGLWRMKDGVGVDTRHKENFAWTSMIRLPDFVTEEMFHWAKETAAKKKRRDFSAAEFFTYEEGLCVQCMHIGPYDDEPATLQRMERYSAEQGYENDFSDQRLHHEIYLGDPRKTAPEKLKTILRQPVKKRG
ncbi:MAG TPA: GyrI-like domain-containing protein [Clostridiales bacterium]|nr:GyrI-like domain-containing protein [Clostridiales bacterium]